MSGHWSENAALFKRLVKIHSNPPILFNYDIVSLIKIAISQLIPLLTKIFNTREGISNLVGPTQEERKFYELY